MGTLEPGDHLPYSQVVVRVLAAHDEWQRWRAPPAPQLLTPSFASPATTFRPQLTMTRVEELHQLSDLAPYRLRWQRLLGETRGATYLQSLDWLETLIKHAGRTLELKVLSIAHGRQSLGMLPLVMVRRRAALGTIRQLSYPLPLAGGSYGPIGPNPTATLTAGLRHLAQSSRDWDTLVLDGVNESVDRGRTEHALRRAGFRPTRRLQATRAIVDFSGHWNQYLASRSPQLLPDVRRAENLLTTQGAWEYVHYRPEGSVHHDDDPRWDLYQACEQIANNNGGSSQDQPIREVAQAFFRDVHEQAACSGNVDLHLLQVERRTVAFVYGYLLHGHGLAHRWGVDRRLPSDAAQAAMTVLLARCLESCCRAGDLSYDLGNGLSQCGRVWQTRDAASESYTHLARSPRSLLLQLTNMVRNWRQRGAPQVALE